MKKGGLDIDYSSLDKRVKEAVEKARTKKMTPEKKELNRLRNKLRNLKLLTDTK